MTNVGIIPGLQPSAGQDFVPKLVGFGGSPTQTIIKDTRRAVGRYIINNQGLVVYSGSITFASGDTIGSGENIWGISLPFPANRSSGGADLPIGSAFLWQGSASNPQLVLTGLTSLMDPVAIGGGSQGAQDYYFQTFLTEIIAFGTGAFTSGATTCTIDASAQLGTTFTPNAYDLHIVPTNVPSTNAQWLSVQNINSGTNAGTGKFDVVIKASATTTPVQFAWRARAWPNTSATFAVLMNSQRPWAWANGHSIGWRVQYEAKR